MSRAHNNTFLRIIHYISNINVLFDLSYCKSRILVVCLSLVWMLTKTLRSELDLNQIEHLIIVLGIWNQIDRLSPLLFHHCINSLCVHFKNCNRSLDKYELAHYTKVPNNKNGQAKTPNKQCKQHKQYIPLN